MIYTKRNSGLYFACLLLIVFTTASVQIKAQYSVHRISLNQDWRFFKGDPAGAKGLSYDVRPDVVDKNDNIIADTKPTEGVVVKAADTVLKKWILPSANSFINDPLKRHQRPVGTSLQDVVFTHDNYNDSEWQQINLPHDWAIKGPFYTEANAIIGGGMGRLPVQGIGWYRKKITIAASDAGKSIYLDIDGAMSYAMVWCNGQLAGGWPYGYNSFRIDLTEYVKPGKENQLAIRLDNPTNSARWYPGAGIYRNVWLTKVNPVHVAQW
jgi:beta-galactosidase